jgi:hypothetical protein
MHHARRPLMKESHGMDLISMSPPKKIVRFLDSVRQANLLLVPSLVQIVHKVGLVMAHNHRVLNASLVNLQIKINRRVFQPAILVMKATTQPTAVNSARLVNMEQKQDVFSVPQVNS